MRQWIHDGYPGGSRQQFSNPDRLAWRQQPCKLVAHTVEGGGYPTASVYDNGRRAPHVTVDPWHQTWRQHYPLTEAAWALRATSLVSTNTMGAVQVEIIGTCDPGRASLAAKFVPGMSGEPLRYLIGLLRYICREAGIPWQAAVEWVAYPASYGTGARQRLSASAWTAYRGLIGHQHVPGNSHGDPGAIPIGQWLALGSPTTTTEDDMPTPQDLIDALKDARLVTPDSAPRSVFDALNHLILLSDTTLVEQRAQTVALTAAVQALAGAVGVDPAQVQATVREAVDAALAGLRISREA